MLSNKKIIFWGLFLMVGAVFMSVSYLKRDILRETVELALLPNFETLEQPKAPRYIAHGGGAVGNIYKSNSLTALSQTYARGYRYFEIDLNWTTDGALVSVHDWDDAMEQWFGSSPCPVSKQEFNKLKMSSGLQQMDFDTIKLWLKQHPDSFIITDVKSKNWQALNWIKENYPKVVNQLIPQVYRLPEYTKVRRLGYTSIILTLYRSRYTDRGIVEFAKRAQPFAITMPMDRALSPSSLPTKLANVSIFTYTHGPSDLAQLHDAFNNGINGIYTNKLLPQKSPEE